jgi:hypothetical protein
MPGFQPIYGIDEFFRGYIRRPYQFKLAVYPLNDVGRQLVLIFKLIIGYEFNRTKDGHRIGFGQRLLDIVRVK